MDVTLPVYIISTAADLLGVHPRTLHLYEDKGLLVSVRKGNRRFYSSDDLEWVRAVRYMIRERGLNLEGLRQLLALRALIEYETASLESGGLCEAFVGPTLPCWQNHPQPSGCYDCPIYMAARESLREDEGVPDVLLHLEGR